MQQKHFEILKKYENQLNQASANFCRLTPAQFDEVAMVFREMYGVSVTQAERNCSTCKLRILKQLARALAQAKAEFVKGSRIASEGNAISKVVDNIRESIEQAAEAAACAAEVAATTKPKRGRKPRKKTE